MGSSVSSSALLRRLVLRTARYGEGCAATKLDLLRKLARCRLPTARGVLRLHEALCFLRAYPDDPAVLQQVDKMLAGFSRREDLRRHRDELADSGISGTAIRYNFYWPMARWLARNWPERLGLDRDDEESEQRIATVLPTLLTRVESEALPGLEARRGRPVDRLRPRGRTDATFLVRAIEALPGNRFTREALHDLTDPAYELTAGPDTPSRTGARHAAVPVVFRREPPPRGRPDLRRELRRAPSSVRDATRREGSALLDLARSAMVTRSRDLAAFGYGDSRDVRIVDDGDGLGFALIGVVPERRAVLHATYGGLMLRNGVPIGYLQVDALGGSASISFNIFETFRGTEAAFVFARLLAAVRHVFGVRSFSIEPYQLGAGNDEGLDSGAWWFYFKLGFRPRDASVRRIASRERQRMVRDAGHRSDRATLRALASVHLFHSPSSHAPAPPPPWRVGLSVARFLGERDSSDRVRAVRECSAEAGRLLGVGSRRTWTPGERRAWSRWAPLIVSLPGVAHWPPSERRGLVEVVRSKGRRRESEFLEAFDRHSRLSGAIRKLALRG